MDSMDSQKYAAVKHPGFIIEVPEGTVSKYLTPSVGRQIIAGAQQIKGSCVPYHQLIKYDRKHEKLAAIHADWSDKFAKEAGLCQYLFPFRQDAGIVPCDRELKPHWVFPFTGTGFIASTDGSIPLHYYLTRELTPGAGHVLIFFDDDGHIEKVYTFDPASQVWVDAEDAQDVGGAPTQEMERAEWNRLVRESLEKQDVDPNSIMIWGKLFLLGGLYAISRTRLEDGRVAPYLGLRDETPCVLLFTSKALAKAYIALVGLDMTEFNEPLLRYKIPQDIPYLLRLQEHGVQEVLINSGVTDQGLHASLANLPEMYAWHLRHDPRVGAPPVTPAASKQRVEEDGDARPETAASEKVSKPDDGPLSAWGRFRLLCRKPWQAFARMTEAEAKQDSLWIFFLYFLVMTPVQVHQFLFRGKLHSLGQMESWLVIGGGVLGAMITTAILFLIGGAVLHLLLNRAMGCGRRFMVALTMPALCLAPQLALVVHYPLLLLYWGESAAFVTLLLARILATLLTLRIGYWGLRTWFGLSRGKAFMVIGLPVVVMALSFER
jgi:hypothetical protein